jgi:5'-3' exonuclease
MGVRGLYTYCKKYLKPIRINKNLRIGIDVSSLLYRFNGDFHEIYKFLTPLLKNKLIFVFDGKAPKYKEKELDVRKETKESANKRISLLKEIINEPVLEDLNEETIILIKKRIKELEIDNWTLTYEIIKEFKIFLKSKNLVYVKSNSEADSLLVDLYYHNYIDIILSNDMDYLVSGIDKLYINVKGEIREINLYEILEFEDINVEQFRDVAILSGIDNNKYMNIDDVDKAISYIRHYGSISNMNNQYDKFFIDLNYDEIIETKKRFYPSKNINTYLKQEHKDIIDVHME